MDEKAQSSLPQGIKSVKSIKRLQLAHRDLTRISYVKSSSLTIMGHLKGGRIENITIWISTMLQYKNYKLYITKRSLEEGLLQSPHWWSAQWVPPHLVGWLLFFLNVVLEAPTRSAFQSTWCGRGSAS